MNAKNRIHQFISRQRVLITDLALRFLADSNLHSIRFTLSDCDPAYAQNDETTVTKKSGGFLITREIGRWEPFYGTETEIMPPVFTHDIKRVKALISELLNYDAAEVNIINQRGRNSNIKIVRFAEK